MKSLIYLHKYHSLPTEICSLTLFCPYPPLKPVLLPYLIKFLVAFQATSRHLTLYRTSLIKNYLELEQNFRKSLFFLYKRTDFNILLFVVDVFCLTPLVNQNSRKNIFLGDWEPH